MSIKKILLPVDFPNASVQVVHQAATLARRFHSEIVLLHVVNPFTETVEWAQEQLDQSLRPELEGITVRRVLVQDEPIHAIMQAAQVQKADLIMMPPRGYTFDQFLLGSLAAKVIHGIDCPIWTSAHVEESQAREFAISNVLCSVDFSSRSHKTVSWAAQMASEFGGRLTLVHVTASVELWGPGGDYINPKWNEALVGDASQHLAELQRDMGIKTDVFIGSGDVPRVLSQAAMQTKADLLVTECYPYGGNLRIYGYAIICAVPIPVLSV